MSIELYPQRNDLVVFIYTPNSNTSKPMCLICLEEQHCPDRIYVSHDSKHSYHGNCIIRWLQNHDFCPHCHQTVENIEQFRRISLIALLSQNAFSELRERLEHNQYHPADLDLLAATIILQSEKVTNKKELEHPLSSCLQKLPETIDLAPILSLAIKSRQAPLVEIITKRILHTGTHCPPNVVKKLREKADQFFSGKEVKDNILAQLNKLQESGLQR